MVSFKEHCYSSTVVCILHVAYHSPANLITSTPNAGEDSVFTPNSVGGNTTPSTTTTGHSEKTNEVLVNGPMKDPSNLSTEFLEKSAEISLKAYVIIDGKAHFHQVHLNKSSDLDIVCEGMHI